MTDFVGDYTTKKKLAEALRKRQEGALEMVKGLDMGTLKTAGMGGGGDGIYAQPGREQINYGAPIAALGTAFMNRGREAQATAAEADAQKARLEALKQITSGGGLGQGGTLSPEQASQLQELGVDSATMKLMMPSKTNLGAVTQAASTPAGIRALVTTGTWTKEQGDQALAQLEADKAATTEAEKASYLFEQQNKSHRPTQGRAETEIEWAQRDPEGWAAYQQKRAQAAMTGKPAPVSPYDKKLQEEQAKVDVKLMEGAPKIEAGIARADKYLAEQVKNKYDGTKWRAADDAAKLVGLPPPSSYSAEVQKQNQDAKQFHLDAMEQMRGFGQVTEAEQAIIAATQFDIYDTAEARTKKVQTIRDQLVIGRQKVEAARKRKDARTPYDSGGGADPLDAEIDSIMAQ